MILAAHDEGCVREVLRIAAALSIPDPRERPVEREAAARQKHARFADEHSDFMSYLSTCGDISASVEKMDTHVTTVVSCAFLFFFGTPAVKGFAATLVIGLVTNLFTSVFVSRIAFDWGIFAAKASRTIEHRLDLGMPKTAHRDWNAGRLSRLVVCRALASAGAVG